MRTIITTKWLYNSIIGLIALMLLLAASFVNYVVQDRSRSEVEAITQQHLSHYHNRLVTNLQNHIQIVRGLPGLFAVNPALTQDQFAIAMRHLINGQNQLRNIAAAPDMQIQYMFPVEGNEAAIGLNYREHPEQFEAAQRAKTSGELVLAGPLQLRQGGNGLITRIPVFLEQQGTQVFWGIISAVIDSEQFFAASGLIPNEIEIELAIRGKDGLGEAGDVIWGDAALFNRPQMTMRLDLPEGHWILAAQPLGGWEAEQRPVWQTGGLIYGIAFLAFGLLTSFIRFMFAASRANLKFRNLIESSPIPYALVNRNKRISYINQSFTESYGYGYAELTQLSDLWAKTTISQPFRHQMNLWCEGILLPMELPETPTEIDIITKSGEQRVALISISILQESVSDELLLVMYDITLRKAAEQQLRFASQVFDQAHEAIMITTTQGIILDINPAFTEITGYQRQDIIGASPNVLKSEKHNAGFFAEMWHALAERHYWQGEVWNRHKSGYQYAILITVSALHDADGVARHYVGMFSDITQTKQHQETLSLMAHYDVLTKLPNRVLFADRFEQAVVHSQHTQTWLGICFLDLDNFKPVNDEYGHEVGDQLLIQVAERLAANMRDDDTLSRYGGDEFAFIFRDIESYEQCQQLLERIHYTLAQPFTVGKLTLRISASSGISIYPMDDADLDTLVRHADQAMYQAKLIGRDTYHFFNPQQNQKTIAKNQLLREINEAIEANELVLHYQPEVNMKTGKIMGFEALVRWQHPQKGLLMPLHFLPMIYGTSQEVALGYWVIQHALSQLQILHANGHKVFVSVNIAASHLQAAGFVERLEAMLQQYPQLPNHRLQLEILETSALGDVGAISQIIRHCREKIGVTVALDDFGTGYSSLTHLRHLHASAIKIDQSFLRDMLDDPDDFNIIDGVIGLARVFNRQVVAEGVETQAQGKMLLLLGCELAQGYFIARPMPAEVVESWIADYQHDKDWQAFAALPRSSQQTALQMFMLISERWLNKLRVVSSSKSFSWPVINDNARHCAQWIKQAQQQHLFEPEFLTLLIAQHQQFHDIALQFKSAMERGETDTVDWQQLLEEQFEALHQVIADYDKSI